MLKASMLEGGFPLDVRKRHSRIKKHTWASSGRRGQYWRAENLSSVRRKTLCSIIGVWASCCSRPSDDVRHRRFRSSRTGRRLLLIFVHRRRLRGRCAGVVGVVKQPVLLGGGPKDMRQQGNIFASAFCSIPQDFDINSSVKFSKKTGWNPVDGG